MTRVLIVEARFYPHISDALYDGAAHALDIAGVHSERLDVHLAQLHVPHYFLRLPWATHGFDFNPGGPGGQLADYAIGRFLARVTR